MGKQQRVKMGSRILSGVATFVLMVIGVVTFIALDDKPYGIQIATTIIYSLGIVYLVFFPTKLGIGFELNSTAVRRSAQRLLLWHLLVLGMLIVFLTVALEMSPHLPAWLNKEDTRHRTLFTQLLMVVFVVVGVAQASKFRTILRREELNQMREERLR